MPKVPERNAMKGYLDFVKRDEHPLADLVKTLSCRLIRDAAVSHAPRVRLRESALLRVWSQVDSILEFLTRLGLPEEDLLPLMDLQAGLGSLARGKTPDIFRPLQGKGAKKSPSFIAFRNLIILCVEAFVESGSPVSLASTKVEKLLQGYTVRDPDARSGIAKKLSAKALQQWRARYLQKSERERLALYWKQRLPKYWQSPEQFTKLVIQISPEILERQTKR